MATGSRMSKREYEEWRDRHTWDPRRDAGLAIQDDLAPAAWLEPLLFPDSFEVRMTVPQGFGAYARVFFPFAGEYIVGEGLVVGQEQITWAEMARRNGRVAHALMEQETPKVRHPLRDYYLLRGSLDTYGDFPDAASYWWPDDRAWCWSTDIDFNRGYLAASAACVSEVLADPILDALATRPDNPAHAGMDTVNDPTGSVPRSP
jgi:hypothetical protein